MDENKNDGNMDAVKVDINIPETEPANEVKVTPAEAEVAPEVDGTSQDTSTVFNNVGGSDGGNGGDNDGFYGGNNNGDGKTPEDESKKWSTISLVLGVLGIVGGFIPIIQYFTTVCAILAIIFGVKARKLSAAIYGKPAGMATAGFVLGIVGVACAIIGIICVCAGVAILGAADVAGY